MCVADQREHNTKNNTVVWLLSGDTFTKLAGIIKSPVAGLGSQTTIYHNNP